MIKGIGAAGPGRVDTPRTEVVQRGPATQQAAPIRSEATTATNPAAEMAASGPPIDAEKIAAIRAAIAEGRYPIDPAAIADKMMALDLPARNQ